MKNFLFKGRSSILCGLVIVASCSQSKEMPQSLSGECNEIRFGSNGVRVESKSFVETTNSLLQANGFKAAVVVDSDSSVMFNTSVVYDNTDAVYRVPDEHYYYPSEGTVSIYGVYPSSEIISVSSGEATVTYAQNPDEDLVGAKAVAVERQSTPVLMEFEHLLSQVTMTVKTDNPNIACKLYSITLTDADGGVYSFTDDSWVLNETKGDYQFFNSSEGESVATDKSDVGEAMSFMPGKVDLDVKWKCFNRVGNDLVSENDQTVSVELVKGKHSTLNLTLPSNSSEITLVTTIDPWIEVERDIEVKPQEFVFTVNDSGKKVKFAPGNLYWDGTRFRFEEHQYDHPTAWISDHVGYFHWSKDASIAVAEESSECENEEKTAGDKFFAADGGAIEGWTVLSRDEWDYVLKHNLHTVPIEGVKLYNFGEGYTYIGTYEQAKAFYEAEEWLVNNFANNYPFLTDFDELLKEECISVSDVWLRNVAGEECAILKPDGFSGSVADTYTAEEWAAAENDYGLVAFPLAGYSEEGYIWMPAGDINGIYWSTTRKADILGEAWCANFSAYGPCMTYLYCTYGYSVRLVQVL